MHSFLLVGWRLAPATPAGSICANSLAELIRKVFELRIHVAGGVEDKATDSGGFVENTGTGRGKPNGNNSFLRKSLFELLRFELTPNPLRIFGSEKANDILRFRPVNWRKIFLNVFS